MLRLLPIINSYGMRQLARARGSGGLADTRLNLALLGHIINSMPSTAKSAPWSFGNKHAPAPLNYIQSDNCCTIECGLYMISFLFNYVYQAWEDCTQ